MAVTTLDPARARLRAVPAPPPAAVLAAMVAAWSVLFGFLTWRQHTHWNSLGFDTGIYDQGIWLLSQGEDPFMTMRGMDYWGHHVSLIGLVFAVPYRFGAGVHLLTLVHTVWLGLAAVPLWLLARDRTGRPWLSLSVPAAWLLHPALHWLAWWLYHPDSFAVTPLLTAWWAASRRRWWLFGASAGLAMSCKEDVALAVAAMGLALVLWRRDVRVGAATVAVGVGWFLLTTKVVMPIRNEAASTFYESYFPTLGSSLGEILYNLVRHPSRAWGLVTRPQCLDYAVRMLGPVGFALPLLGPAALLVGVPQTGVNLLVEVQNGATIRSQYASLPLTGIFLGVAEGFGFLQRRWSRLLPAAVVVLVASALVGTRLWGLSPLGVEWENGPWGKHPRPNIAQLEEAKRLVPPQGRLSASWNVVTQFTHRKYAYEFPNPWVSSNYGITGNEVDDPSTVDWIFVELSALGPRDLALLGRLTGPDGDFRVLYQSNGVLVAERWRPDTVGNP